MKEILFRGKADPTKYPHTKEWVEGSYIHQTQYYGDPADNHWILVGGEFDMDFYDAYPVIPETLGQFTGKCDKNGKRIFEGDIVKAMMDYGPAGMIESVVDIGFKQSVGGYRWNYFDMDTIEVIGNVYDNFDLLKGD